MLFMRPVDRVPSEHQRTPTPAVICEMAANASTKRSMSLVLLGIALSIASVLLFRLLVGLAAMDYTDYPANWINHRLFIPLFWLTLFSLALNISGRRREPRGLAIAGLFITAIPCVGLMVLFF